MIEITMEMMLEKFLQKIPKNAKNSVRIIQIATTGLSMKKSVCLNLQTLGSNTTRAQFLDQNIVNQQVHTGHEVLP